MNYLYNGVELPDIDTVWTDKETYPYAAVLYDGETYMVLLSSSVFSYDSAINWVGSYAFYALVDGAYTLAASGADSGGLSFPAIWTSHDILNTDGTTYLAASEPVSVPVGGVKEEQFRIWKTTLTGIADKIREKTGKTEKFPFSKEAVSQEIDAVYQKGVESVPSYITVSSIEELPTDVPDGTIAIVGD